MVNSYFFSCSPPGRYRPSDQNRYAQPEAVQTLLPRGAFGKTV